MSCHQDIHRAWSDSDHALAHRLPDPTRDRDLLAPQAFALHGVDPAATARYEAMRSRIREGLEAGRTQDAILEDLVGIETRRAFGERAGDELRAKVAARFREDPSLRRLFEELMGVVRADAAPPAP